MTPYVQNSPKKAAAKQFLTTIDDNSGEEPGSKTFPETDASVIQKYGMVRKTSLEALNAVAARVKV